MGEIYDKLPKFVTQARFNLNSVDVSPKFDGMELDICIKFARLSENDYIHVSNILKKYLPNSNYEKGLGMEIRYNFNPNDSSRLRKDKKMAELLKENELFPVYLVFSSSSPRNDAIRSLKNAGWAFLIGNDSIRFIKDLLSLEIGEILDRPKVKEEMHECINELMDTMHNSFVFKTSLEKYHYKHNQ